MQACNAAAATTRICTLSSGLTGGRTGTDGSICACGLQQGQARRWRSGDGLEEALCGLTGVLCVTAGEGSAWRSCQCSRARLMWGFAGEGPGRATGSRRRRARARPQDGSEVGAASSPAAFAFPQPEPHCRPGGLGSMGRGRVEGKRAQPTNCSGPGRAARGLDECGGLRERPAAAARKKNQLMLILCPRPVERQ